MEAAADWEVEGKEEADQRWGGRQTGGSRCGGSSRLEATEVEAADWRQQRWRQKTRGSGRLEAIAYWRKQ